MMNNRGFTLVELLAVIVVLAMVTGIGFWTVNYNYKKTLSTSEEVFVETIRDALDIYLNSDASKLSFTTKCSGMIVKSYGSVSVYKAEITFLDVINSTYKPITQSDLVNPGNKNVSCSDAGGIVVTIYQDEDYVNYYSVSKSSFGCLLNIGGEYTEVISNLPEGFEC